MCISNGDKLCYIRGTQWCSVQTVHSNIVLSKITLAHYLYLYRHHLAKATTDLLPSPYIPVPAAPSGQETGGEMKLSLGQDGIGW
jgi:hypothetical protein